MMEDDDFFGGNMKMGGGFSLDISKAVKPNSSEDNH